MNPESKIKYCFKIVVTDDLLWSILKSMVIATKYNLIYNLIKFLEAFWRQIVQAFGTIPPLVILYLAIP